MRNRFNINEEEKNRIRGLHNINEQTVSSPDGDDYMDDETEIDAGSAKENEKEAAEKAERESRLPDCSDYRHYNKMFEPVRHPNRPPPGAPFKSTIEGITFEYNSAAWGPRSTIWITALKNGKAFCRVVSKHKGGGKRMDVGQ